MLLQLPRYLDFHSANVDEQMNRWIDEILFSINLEAYSKPCQTSKMECFAKKVTGWKPLSVLRKRSILDIWQGFEYTSETDNSWNLIGLSLPRN